MVIEEQRLQALERRLRRVEHELGLRAAAPSPPSPRPVPPPVTEAPPRRRVDLEQLLGGRVLAWVGGAAVVAGLALLLALGISQGWIGEGARTVLGAGLSLALLGVGTWLQERRGRAQAARATAATGICGLFMTLTVATATYGLLPSAVGLVLALATSSLASVLALRWSSPVVGGLGVLGAVIAPVLVDATGATAIAFEAIAVAGAVGVLLRARWGWLMLTTFALSAPQWVGWVFGDHSLVAIVLVPCVFGLLYAAAALGFELRVPAERLRPAPALLLTANALTLSVAGWMRLDGLGHDDLATAWLGFLAAAHLVAGIAAYRSRRISSDIGLVGLTLSVLLADVACALLTDGAVRAAGFAIGGVAFARLARRRGRTEGVLAEWGLGGHIAVAAIQAIGDAAAGSTAPAVAGLVAVAAACLVSARVSEAGHRRLRVVLDAAGLAAVAGIAALTLHGAALTLAWSAEAVALARIGRRDEVARIASFVHLAAAATFALVDQAPPSALVAGADDVLAALLGVGGAGLAALLVAVTLGAGDPARRVLVPAAGVAALYAASVLVVALGPDAQGQLLLSALWTVAGLAALIAGLRRDERSLRLGAWALLGLAAGKVFLYDLAALQSVYRAGSFLALGLLLLAGALAYQRMRPALTA